MRKKQGKLNINIPLPVEIINELQNVRKKTGAPMNFTIEKAVREYLQLDSSPTGGEAGSA